RFRGPGTLGSVHAVEPALPIHRYRADSFRVRHVDGRLAILINLENSVVVFLCDEHASVFVGDDAIGAVAALLPDFCPHHPGSHNAWDRHHHAITCCRLILLAPSRSTAGLGHRLRSRWPRPAVLRDGASKINRQHVMAW